MNTYQCDGESIQGFVQAESLQEAYDKVPEKYKNKITCINVVSDVEIIDEGENIPLYYVEESEEAGHSVTRTEFSEVVKSNPNARGIGFGLLATFVVK